MRCEIGLKLFSTNLGSLEIVEKLFHRKLFNYIELMVIPNSYRKTILSWKSLKMPVVIHAPHSQYGFNLSDKRQGIPNMHLFDEVRKYADSLSADAIIVHPGITGEMKEAIRQIKAMKDKRILVENMPFISLIGTKHMGSSPDEIREILKETECGFCLDVAHALKSAYSNGKEVYAYLAKFLALKPKILHLCGVNIKGCYDEHLCLDKGDLDIRKVFESIKNRIAFARLTLEIPEKDYDKLLNFRKAAKTIRKLASDI